MEGYLKHKWLFILLHKSVRDNTVHMRGHMAMVLVMGGVVTFVSFMF